MILVKICQAISGAASRYEFGRLHRFLVAMMLIGLCSATHAQVPSEQEFQGWLHKQVDEGSVPVILPFERTALTTKLSHEILMALWKSPSYRLNLQKWLAMPHASMIAEDLLSQWRVRMHYALVASFEFLDPDSLSAFWRLDGGNGVYGLKREVCDSDSAEVIDSAVRAEQEKLLRAQLEHLAKHIPVALDLEYARENLPYLADRPSPKALSVLVQNTLRESEANLSEEDVARIEARFSRAPPAQTSAREACEVNWLASRFVNDFKGEDPGKSVSGALMRLAIISSAYTAVFARLDTPVGIFRPQIPGFTAYKGFVFYPSLALATGVHGDATYRVSVDQTGHAIDIVTLASTVQPQLLHSIDGTTVPSDKVLTEVVSAYVRAGLFEMKSENGSTVPFQVEVEIHWQSEGVKH